MYTHTHHTYGEVREPAEARTASLLPRLPWLLRLFVCSPVCLVVYFCMDVVLAFMMSLLRDPLFICVCWIVFWLVFGNGFVCIIVYVCLSLLIDVFICLCFFPRFFVVGWLLARLAGWPASLRFLCKHSPRSSSKNCSPPPDFALRSLSSNAPSCPEECCFWQMPVVWCSIVELLWLSYQVAPLSC